MENNVLKTGLFNLVVKSYDFSSFPVSVYVEI
jgi:hypothetical protein